MASLNTLLLRERQAGLRVLEIPVEMPPVEPSAHVAVSVEMRRRSYLVNVQRSQRIAATNRGRDIPVGGVGRWRAKRHRQAGLCLEVDGGKRCTEPAAEHNRCASHQPEPAEAAA